MTLLLEEWCAFCGNPRRLCECKEKIWKLCGCKEREVINES